MRKDDRKRDVECTAADIRRARDIAVQQQLRRERIDRLLEVGAALLVLLGLVVVIWWLAGGGHGQG